MLANKQSWLRVTHSTPNELGCVEMALRDDYDAHRGMPRAGC